jgi:hypothetical protein
MSQSRASVGVRSVKRTIFGPEHEAFREMVRSFVAREVVPEYPKWEVAGTIFERRS